MWPRIFHILHTTICPAVAQGVHHHQLVIMRRLGDCHSSASTHGLEWAVGSWGEGTVVGVDSSVSWLGG